MGEASKPETIAQLKRKIERLEARLRDMEAHQDAIAPLERQQLYRVADAEVKIKQAMRILSGEDEV